MPFGAHMSIAGGVSKAFGRGEYVACEVMQIFSKNERQWQAKPYSDEEIAAFQAEQQRTGIAPVIVHASYLINLAAPAAELWEKSIAAFADELERCAVLDIPAIVIHPGAHTGSGETAGLQRIVAALDRLFAAGTGTDVTVLLETTAGQGTSLGCCFEHLAYVLEHVTCPQRWASVSIPVICWRLAMISAPPPTMRQPSPSLNGRSGCTISRLFT